MTTHETPPNPPPLTPDLRLIEARQRAFQSTDPAAAFAHFRAQAEAVPAQGLAVFNANPEVVLTNVKAAVSVLAPRLHEAARHLVDPPYVTVLELPSLALALVHAANRVPGKKLSEGEIAEALSEVAPWRALTLRYLEVVSDPKLDLLPAERVRAVRSGTGPLDLAGDAVVLSDLFAEYGESLEGKHPFQPHHLSRMAELGATLLQSIKPARAPATPSERQPAAVLRDQFAALLVARYEALRLCASAVLGPTQAAAAIPALRASAAPAAVAAAAEPVA